MHHLFGLNCKKQTNKCCHSFMSAAPLHRPLCSLYLKWPDVCLVTCHVQTEERGVLKFADSLAAAECLKCCWDGSYHIRAWRKPRLTLCQSSHAVRLSSPSRRSIAAGARCHNMADWWALSACASWSESAKQVLKTSSYRHALSSAAFLYTFKNTKR